ncbi:ATP-dependent helicase [Thermosulfuriphilus sp.]
MSRFDLDADQAKAVATPYRTTLVIAGPGAGKTRLILARVAFLLEAGLQPEEILVLTFSTRAAGELLSRAKGWGDSVQIKTFHAAARALFRKMGLEVFQPASQEERFEALKEASLRAGFKASRRDLSRILTHFSLVKSGSQKLSPEFSSLFALYNQVLEEVCRGDFDDFLLQIISHLAPSGGPFRQVIVDEFQDASPTDLLFLKSLRPEGYFLVGDPFQAIYGFRGAGGPGIFEAVRREFPDVGEFRLKRSYRVPAKILEVACRLVGAPAFESLQRGGRLEAHLFPSPRAEAVFIGKTIEALVGGRDFLAAELMGVREAFCWGDFAVLVRLKALVAPLKEALISAGLPVFFRDEAREALRRKLEAFSRIDLSGRRPEEIKTVAQDLKLTFSRPEEAFLKALFPLVDSLEDLVFELLYQADAPRDQEAISLSTIHAAKGLEFPVVFVAGFEETLMPYTLKEGDEDEERRLAYVAFTRAQEALYLTASSRRFLFGRSLPGRPSPFWGQLGLKAKIHRLSIKKTPPRQNSLF